MLGEEELKRAQESGKWFLAVGHITQDSKIHVYTVTHEFPTSDLIAMREMISKQITDRLFEEAPVEPLPLAVLDDVQVGIHLDTTPEHYTGPIG